MKKSLIAALIALSVVAAVAGYAVFDNFFPKADSPLCPAAESVTSVTLIQSGGSSATAEAEDFGEILRNIASARPTRRMSVNDYPAAEGWYTLEIDTEEGEYRYFLYAENSQVYIESPYVGIYKADRQFLDYVKSCFGN